jgi:hypothetical protein
MKVGDRMRTRASVVPFILHEALHLLCAVARVHNAMLDLLLARLAPQVTATQRTKQDVHFVMIISCNKRKLFAAALNNHSNQVLI